MRTTIKISNCIIVLFVSLSIFAQSEGGNKKDSVYNQVQFSFIPFMSTNLQPVTNNECKVNINLIAGQVNSVNGVEVGGILNMDRHDVKSCQVAGIGNIVGGSSKGYQGAGIFNITKSVDGVQNAGIINLVKGDVRYCQLAGIANINKGSVTGFQAAGIANIAGGDVEGTQVGGVVNIAKSFNGAQVGGCINLSKGNTGRCQVAGLTNVTEGSVKGPQISGLINIVDTIKGPQISGLANISKEINGPQISGLVNVVQAIKGPQIAGLVNIANEVNGVQISGLVNRASVVKGTQIGFINIADSCNGVPIGFMSFVKNGYHKIEISADEIIYTNIAFKVGVKELYTFLFAGIRPDNFDRPLWTHGFGVGSILAQRNNLSYNIELSSQYICKGTSHNYLSSLNRLYFGVDNKLTSHLSLSTGVTYNVYIVDTDSPDYKGTLSSIAPYHLTNHTTGNWNNIKSWIGVRVALRIL